MFCNDKRLHRNSYFIMLFIFMKRDDPKKHVQINLKTKVHNSINYKNIVLR